jgi:hypothetical protein
MAKQNGIIKLSGALDGIVFVRRKDGDFAKVRTGSVKMKMSTGANYERTRENMNEFKAAGKSTGLLRMPFAEMIAENADTQSTARLTKLMMDVIKLDSTSKRGERTPGTALALPAVKQMLENFNFNINAKLHLVLYTVPAVDVNTGVITLANFNPQKFLALPAQATHVTISGAWAKVDFNGRNWEVQTTNAVNLQTDNTVSNVVLTPSSVPSLPGLSLFVIKVEFFEEVNGDQYSLRNGSNNPVCIFKVD